MAKLLSEQELAAIRNTGPSPEEVILLDHIAALTGQELMTRIRLEIQRRSALDAELTEGYQLWLERYAMDVRNDGMDILDVAAAIIQLMYR